MNNTVLQQTISFLENKNNNPYITYTTPDNPTLYYKYAPEIEGFINYAYEKLLASSWVQFQEEAKKYIEDPKELENAGIEILKKLITLHIRKERFVEGHIARTIDCGHFIALLKKLESLNTPK